MPEGFELVRTIRQHLRRGAAYLDEGKLDDALKEIEAALALDAESLPAQALRDRIRFAQATARASAVRPCSDRAQAAGSFVPHGVNAASWRGFEQRITERRFRALLATINTAIGSGDIITARVALEEARELRPDAAELSELETRLAAVPVGPIAFERGSASRIWIRAMGAAALFLIGVSLLLGLEWMRPDEHPVAPPIVAPEAPASAPAPEPQLPPSPNLAPVPVARNLEEEYVPAILTPPEPLLQPRGTSGGTPPPIAGRAVVLGDAMPPPTERTLERQAVIEGPPVRARGGIADEYVASHTMAEVAATPDAGPSSAVSAGSSTARLADTVVTADTPRERSTVPASAVVPAAAGPAIEHDRVEEVLRRYARAYRDLDASAARAVWPSVDEKALAKAFKDLASQNVSFDGCDIDVRGAVANASCRGQQSYVVKIGSREPRSETRLWRFELRRDGDAWKIESAEARRESGTAYQER